MPHDMQAVQVAPVLVGLYLPEGSMFEFFSGGLSQHKRAELLNDGVGLLVASKVHMTPRAAADGLWGAANCQLPPGPPNATDAALRINPYIQAAILDYQ